MELPELVSLPAADAAGETYSLIRWYHLGLDGKREVVLRTYHRFSGGWYVEIPESWDERVTISRAEEIEGCAGRADVLVLEWLCAGRPDFYDLRLHGEKRLERAQEDERFLLLEQPDVCFSAQLGTAAQAQELTPDELRQMFHIIHVDWNTGET